MKKLRDILDWIPLISLIVGGIAFSIYFQKWILLGLIILGIVLYGGCIYLLGMGLESGFRNRFPLDYLRHVSTEVDFFKEKDYQIISYEDPGSEHPGVLMQKENSPDVRIILNAPLNSTRYTINVYIKADPERSIDYSSTTSAEDRQEKLTELSLFTIVV